MKKENWILMLSIIALCLSILSFLMWFCKYKPITWTLLDVCFSVISAGITVFVAAQIYHSFTLIRKIEERNLLLKQAFEEESKKQVNKLKELFKNHMRSFDHNVAATTFQLHAICEYFSRGKYEAALDEFMKALKEANMAKKHEIEGIENPSAGIISYIQQFKERNISMTLNAEKVEEYKMILAQTNNKEAIDLIPYIQSLLGMKKCQYNE